MSAGLTVHGVVGVPGDKSISHRALIIGALSQGDTRIRSILQSADVASTAQCLRQLGVDVPALGPDLVIRGVGAAGIRSPEQPLDCGNSGTTTRLLAGMVAGCAGVEARFIGDASLSARPMRRIAQPLSAMGAVLQSEGQDGLPMRVTGARLRAMEWESEHASAQVKGAILLAALCSGVPVTVHEPSRSRDHTERMLAGRGVAVEVSETSVTLSAGGRLTAGDVEVPGDPSSAAFFVALAGLSQDGELRLPDVCLNPTRVGGLDILRRMGVSVSIEDERDVGGERIGTIIARGGILRATTVAGPEVARAIDELPLVACVAARARGETVITDASELRVKESDRISAVVANLRAIGVHCEELPDGMVIFGGEHALRGHVTTHGDHRLAMAFGLLAALPGNAITIDDPACVAVSFPSYWTELARVVSSVPEGDQPTSAAARAAHFVIAIDGPAASGKSSTSQWVAKRLGVRHVDSGAYYRALTAVALRGTLQPEAWTPAAVLAGAQRISLHLTERAVVPAIDGALVEEELRGSLVTMHVSQVARMASVREWVNDRVREASQSSAVVVDGRDIGTAVFPDAALKVFLVADPAERARRRLLQRLERRPTEDEVRAECDALLARDAKDALQSAPHRDAVTIDTTTLTQEDQVERIVELAREARGGR